MKWRASAKRGKEVIGTGTIGTGTIGTIGMNEMVSAELGECRSV
jgi:PDZ domain-containing secreted protein